MTKKLIIGVFSIMAILITVAVVWFLIIVSTRQSLAPATVSSSTPFSSNEQFPIATTTISSSGLGVMTVDASDGGTVTTNDFIHNGITLPDAANNGRYLLAGNLGYCISNAQKCQAGTATDFNIFYDSTNDSFTIALLREPLGQVRLDVEQFLMTTLGITQEGMCRLNYYIGTTYDVNPLYAGKNLGFSFCPGATVLP